jgi:hypothetical protein
MSPAGIEPTFAGACSLELNPLRAIAKFKMSLGAIPLDPFDRVAGEEDFSNFYETSFRASRRTLVNTRSGSGADV